MAGVRDPYGAEHQAIRRRLHRDHVEGTPCRRCGQPMYRRQGLHAGHPPWAPARHGGKADALEHARCNQRDGARVTNAARRRSRVPLPSW